jgi:hypothetical protein
VAGGVTNDGATARPREGPASGRVPPAVPSLSRPSSGSSPQDGRTVGEVILDPLPTTLVELQPVEVLDRDELNR